MNRPEEAVAATHRATEVARQLADRSPERFSALLAAGLSQLAHDYRQTDAPLAARYRQESLPYWYAATAYLREKLGSDPYAAPPSRRKMLVSSLMAFAAQLVALGRAPEAVPYAREAVDFARSLAREDPHKHQRLFERCQKSLAEIEQRPW